MASNKKMATNCTSLGIFEKENFCQQETSLILIAANGVVCLCSWSAGKREQD